MTEPLVSFEPQDDGIGVIAMSDLADHNAMSDAFVHALLAAFRAAEAWAPLKVILLKGTPHYFCVGASLDMLRSLTTGTVVPTDITLSKAVFDLPVPVIAAMEGHALGGGLALGAAADMAVIARESRYGATFMNMGFTPGMGVTELLTHVMSPTLAAELLYTGQPKKGSFFEGRAFSAVLPRAEVLPYATHMAQQIAEKPRRALELLKQTLSLPRRSAFERTHTLESLMHRLSFADPEVRRRIEEYHGQ